MAENFFTSLSPLRRRRGFSSLLAGRLLRGKSRRDPGHAALSRLTRRLSRQFENQLERSLLSALGELSGAETRRGGGGSDGLPDFAAIAGPLVADLVELSLSQIFSGSTTTVITQETARSQEAAAAFRESRGQVQARLARDLARGQRNL